MGRRPGRDRARFLTYARGSAEEVKEILRGLHNSEIVDEPQFWRVHNRLVTIARMITSYNEKMLRSPRHPT